MDAGPRTRVESAPVAGQGRADYAPRPSPPRSAMLPEVFLQRHDARRHAARRAAASLRAGDPRPASDLLAPTVARAGEHVGRALIGHLLEASPRLAAPDGFALLEPLPGPGHPCLEPGRLAERIRLRRLLADPPPAESEPPADGVAWALCLLIFFGEEIERLEHDAWRAAVYPEQPALDAQTRAWWGLWFQLPANRNRTGGRPVPALGPQGWAALLHGWKSLFRPDALRAYRGVLEHIHCPERDRRHHLLQLREASFARLYCGEGPFLGWVELAARVMERSGQSQLEALATLCDEPARARLANCAAQRGSMATTARALLPGLSDPLLRAQDLAGTMRAGPDEVEALLDAHLGLRLIDSWAKEPAQPLERGWRIVRQNRGRAAARVRAVVAEGCVEALGAHLLALPGLHARTAAAVRAYFWAWGLDLVTHASVAGLPEARGWRDPEGGLAWQAAVDFSYDPERDVTPACTDPNPGPAPMDEDELRALRTWVLLVAMRGRLPQLRAWTDHGGGDKDGGWGRLLADDLPDLLRDPGSTQRERSGYRRLRLALAASLPVLLRELSPLLRALATVHPGRAAAAAVHALLAPAWHPSVRFPQSGFPTILRHAAEALASLPRPEEGA